MKTRNLIVLVVSLVMFSSTCWAQDGNSTNQSANGGQEVSQQCLVNLSLFNESAKNKQYSDALVPWNKVYSECPSANIAIYRWGRPILEWELTQLKNDPVKYENEFKKLMGMYDNRIKYFGDDPRYPTPWILGLKGLDYYNYAINDPLKKAAYPWLETCVDSLKDRTALEILQVLMKVSDGMYKADPSHAPQYIADYVKVNNILNEVANEPNNRYAKYAPSLKTSLDVMFSTSGAANCATLDSLYKQKVQDNITNIPFLTNIVNLYKTIACTNSKVYFAASVALYKNNPTEQSAIGCADMAINMNNYPQAIDFLNQATNYSKDSIAKAGYEYRIAQIYTNMNDYPKARDAAKKSLDYNPKNGKPYILIGKLYVSSTDMYTDNILKKTIYWVAVDEFKKAKEVDPSCAIEANQLIKTYSLHFPTKDEIFFKPQLQAGKPFVVGGWINQSTICR